MSRSGVSNGGGSVAWRITDDIGRRFSMRTPDNPPPVHLQRISILIPGQHLLVSADDTDLILQSDQSVACVNSRLAWSFEWAWMINAVSVGHRVSTYDIPV